MYYNAKCEAQRNARSTVLRMSSQSYSAEGTEAVVPATDEELRQSVHAGNQRLNALLEDTEGSSKQEVKMRKIKYPDHLIMKVVETLTFHNEQDKMSARGGFAIPN